MCGSLEQRHTVGKCPQRSSSAFILAHGKGILAGPKGKPILQCYIKPAIIGFCGTVVPNVIFFLVPFKMHEFHCTKSTLTHN